MRFFWALLRTLVGAAFGVVAMIALSPAISAFTTAENIGSSGVAAVGVIVIGALLGLFAPSIRRAFGRGFLLSGVAFLALPLTTMLLSGKLASEAVSRASQADQAAAAVGAGLGGVLLTGAAAFIGLFVGAIFIIIGLVLALGGRREVVIIERRA